MTYEFFLPDDMYYASGETGNPLHLLGRTWPDLVYDLLNFTGDTEGKLSEKAMCELGRRLQQAIAERGAVIRNDSGAVLKTLTEEQNALRLRCILEDVARDQGQDVTCTPEEALAQAEADLRRLDEMMDFAVKTRRSLRVRGFRKPRAPEKNKGAAEPDPPSPGAGDQ